MTKKKLDAGAIDINKLVEALECEQGDYKLPDPATFNFYWYADRRKLWIDMEVDASIVEFERMILRWNLQDSGKPPEEREPIWIYLMNYGGDADMMWSMVDIIELSETPIYTVNMGNCSSAAAIIFIAGKKRFMMPGAKVMIHEGSGEFEGDATKVLDHAAAYKAMLARMNKFILDHTNIQPRMLSKKRSNDWEIDAKTCLEYGVCDVIPKSLNDIL